MLRWIKPRLTYPHVVSTLALFIAIGGTAYAAATIGSAEIIDNSVASVDLKDGEVKAPDIAAGAVLTDEISNGQVKAADIGDGEVKSADLLDNGATGTDVNESTLQGVNAAKLNGLTSGQIVTGRNDRRDADCALGSAYKDCASVTVNLAKPSRLLMIAHTRAAPELGTAVTGDCLLQIDDASAFLAVTDVYFSGDDSVWDHLSLNTISDVLSAGTHFVDMSCRTTFGYFALENTDLSVAVIGNG